MKWLVFYYAEYSGQSLVFSQKLKVSENFQRHVSGWRHASRSNCWVFWNIIVIKNTRVNSWSKSPSHLFTSHALLWLRRENDWPAQPPRTWAQSCIRKHHFFLVSTHTHTQLRKRLTHLFLFLFQFPFGYRYLFDEFRHYSGSTKKTFDFQTLLYFRNVIQKRFLCQ